MGKIKIRLPFEKHIEIEYKNATFLKEEFYPSNVDLEPNLFIYEQQPDYFLGNFYSYKKLHLYQNFYQNFFILKDHLNLDYRLVISNWIRYLIAFLLKEYFINIHGTLIKYKGNTYLFAGKSGSGKTTIAYNFLKIGGEILTDEFSLINENSASFIPRPLYLRKNIHTQKGSFEYSHILDGYYTIKKNTKIISIEPFPTKIFILKKETDNNSKYYDFIQVIHTFDFYDYFYFKKINPFFDKIKKKIEIFSWKELKELKNFVESF